MKHIKTYENRSIRVILSRNDSDQYNPTSYQIEIVQKSRNQELSVEYYLKLRDAWRKCKNLVETV